MGAGLSTDIRQTSARLYNRASSIQKGGQVIAFHSSTKWKTHFESAKQTSKLMVVDFTASWCGPCRYIEPAINEFAVKYTDVDFIKIDVDELFDVAQDFGVQVMPTFLLMKRGKIVDKVVGAKKDDLQKKIDKHRF
ncbi:thioredoxin H2-like [Primulina tabacum]|uniref:thioredoxin H2-like n=1 Tax=Primulina tabacum TaxID=48773 RepID=UPI003F5A063E